MRLDDQHVRSVLDPIDRHWSSRSGMRDAAVLAPLFARDDEDWLLFTKRRHDLDAHAGEMSFPGGMREGHEDPVECALRETDEEVGLRPAAVEVLGCLSTRSSSVGFNVRAFVGRAIDEHTLTLDAREVERLVWVPVRLLLQEELWRWQWLEHRGRKWNVPFFDHDGETIWGMTGALTRDLVQRLRQV